MDDEFFKLWNISKFGLSVTVLFCCTYTFFCWKPIIVVFKSLGLRGKRHWLISSMCAFSRLRIGCGPYADTKTRWSTSFAELVYVGTYWWCVHMVILIFSFNVFFFCISYKNFLQRFCREHTIASSSVIEWRWLTNEGTIKTTICPQRVIGYHV